MRLKNLEIKGFKSFADKTIVNFDENVTGIVGPNGCGKSNIVDSIRWVIGEQKISHLRSENLDSLVFNGSKTRSASGLAEVSLTFENTRNLLPTEFTTVTVTRKFYKSGESEYRLNDVQCRLKDIQNLFLDTGISNDSYAIIELGMVDDLIKDKDNSRRRMLEQAAGISIYKTRKKEARQKLDATELDLNRIEDLLFEINNQLKALETQAKKAEKYREIKKEYREVSIELAKAALEGFNLTYKDLTDQQNVETDKVHHMEAVIATEDAAVETARLEFINKERNLHSLQSGFNELVQKVREKENQKNLASQKLEYLHEREKNIQDFLAKAEVNLGGISDSISFTTNQVGEEQKKLEHLKGELETLRSKTDESRKVVDEKRHAVEAGRMEFQKVQREQFEAEKNAAIADTSLQNITRSIAQIEEERRQRDEEQERLKTAVVQLEKEIEEKKISLEQLQAHHENTKEQILLTQSILENLRSNLADENRMHDAKKNEYDLLKSMIDSMEGYPDSVKFLHNNPKWESQVPILSDVLNVKEEYRVALENLLEPYLSYYIVENSRQAMAAIELLDEHKKGKANFFILDKLTQPVNAGLPFPQQSISALDVVVADEKYKNLAAHLLGNVCIVEHEQQVQQGIICVEKNGKFVQGNFTISGGSVGLLEGKKIGRIKNLEKILEQVNTFAQNIQNLKADIQEKHNAVIAFNQDLKEVAIKDTERQINQGTNQLFSLQNKLENINNLQGVSEGRLNSLQEQLQVAQDKGNTAKGQLGGLNEKLETINANLQGLNNDFKQVEQLYLQANQVYNDYNLEVTRQQSKITTLQQELNFKANQLQDLKAQIETNQSSLKDTLLNITENTSQLTELQQELVELLRRKEADEKTLNDADKEYYNMRNVITEQESSLRHMVKEKEQSEHLLIAIKDKINDLKLHLAGTRERLNVEFKVNLEEVLTQERNSQVTLEELQEKADRMKKRLDNLGDVNPMAIDAFTEMKKRYEFILEQKNDLESAKDSLLKTIEEVESTANKKFLETFNNVRANFQKVFKTLFTEDDDCDLVLDNPENIAETGIDVVARPKGKRPTSLTQLSGGERTLTATALLFAIYLIKPAPFCILDEVDAPLDDANVGKFTNMIRQFSENSQFIIVTHNKSTMSTVDVIYGVTMQEPGVSKLVSVDFRSLQNINPN